MLSTFAGQPGRLIDRYPRDHVGDPDRAGGVRAGRGQSPGGRAGAHRDDGDGAAGGLLQALPRCPPADHAEGAVAAERDRTLDHDDVPAGGDGVGERLLRPGAGGRHDRLVVVQRDGVEDDVADARVAGPQERLGVTGAVLELQPDQRGPDRLLHRRRNLRREHRGEREHRGDAPGPRQERTPAHPRGGEQLPQRRPGPGVHGVATRTPQRLGSLVRHGFLHQLALPVAPA